MKTLLLLAIVAFAVVAAAENKCYSLNKTACKNETDCFLPPYVPGGDNNKTCIPDCTKITQEKSSCDLNGCMWFNGKCTTDCPYLGDECTTLSTSCKVGSFSVCRADCGTLMEESDCNDSTNCMWSSGKCRNPGEAVAAVVKGFFQKLLGLFIAIIVLCILSIILCIYCCCCRAAKAVTMVTDAPYAAAPTPY